MNLLNHHTDYICAKNFEFLSNKINYYLTGFRSPLNKNHNRLPNNPSLQNHQRYDMILNQIKRCIYARFGDMCYTKNPISMETYISMINTYSKNICENPEEYWEYFKKYDTSYKQNHREKMKMIDEEVKKMVSHIKVLTHMAAIYSLIKMFMIFEKIKELDVDPTLLDVCYIKYSVPFLYKNVFEKLRNIPKEVDKNRQLFSIAQSINDMYHGMHIFTIFIKRGDKKEMNRENILVDTNNNLYMSILYRPTRNQIININQNNRRRIKECAPRNIKNERSIQEYPKYTELHYHSEQFYLFRCDEYFGINIHQRIDELNEYYLANETKECGRSVSKINQKMSSSSSNYKDRCCKNDKNIIYQYIDLFYTEQKRDLYQYIYMNQDEDYDYSQLGIYYLLNDIYQKNNIFIHPPIHNFDNITNYLHIFYTKIPNHQRRVFTFLAPSRIPHVMKESSVNQKK